MDHFRKHHLTSEAEDADGILIVDLHQHPEDWRLALLNDHPLVSRFPHKALVYDERDQPWCKWPGIYVSMPRGSFDPKRQRACSYAQLKNAFSTPATLTPDLLFSFRGACSHPVRAEILAMSHPRAIIENPRFNFFDFSDRSGTREYQDEALQHKEHYRHTIGRSKFVLCPRGSGTSSFRLYETLSAGRVPVIISDAWVPPCGPDWAACSVTVKEAMVKKIPSILEDREADYASLSLAAGKTFQDWFAPEVMFHRLAEQCLDLLVHGRTGKYEFGFMSRSYLRCALRSYKAWLRHRLRLV